MGDILTYALVFVLGLSLGSFLNVVVYRIDDLKSIFFSRSRCPKCQKEIDWYDMVPLISYIILRGKCRNCGKNISYQYPLVESWYGACCLILFISFGISFSTFFYAAIFFGLSVIAIYDFQHQMIPEEFSWAVLILSFFGSFYAGGFSFINSLVGGLIFGGLIFLMYFYSKEKWMGEGDVKIAATAGILSGFPVVFVSMFGAFILGSIAGIAWIYLKKKSIKDSLPFSPFIVMGAFIAIVYGEKLYNLYMSSLYF